MLRIALMNVDGVPVQRSLMAEFTQAGGGIGRDPRNTLVLPDAERRLARVQAVVRFEQGAYRLYDQGLNATLVNGVALKKGIGHPLLHDDLIEANGFVMRVTAVRIPSGVPVSASRPWGVGTVGQDAHSASARGGNAQYVDTQVVDPFDELLAAKPAALHMQYCHSGRVDTTCEELRIGSGGPRHDA
ncbi:FHA domain-containing protein [Uliginosibacterium gangwonense]|uniref:FHA domain-containing protein n=1 Tax=Uliginosibacterium gangwonense TaxID=392736 RepID=UPI0003A19C12|nr:FHA domain-containing protein [Uliginosibacterium gangwonense]